MISVLEQIKPETAARLAAHAQKQGLSIDDFIKSFLIADDSGESTCAQENEAFAASHFQQTATPEEWSRAFRDWARSHPPLPVIADDSREAIYEGRGE